MKSRYGISKIVTPIQDMKKSRSDQGCGTAYFFADPDPAVRNADPDPAAF